MSKTPRSDASYAKLAALRNAGYRGPVDQDGNKASASAKTAKNG